MLTLYRKYVGISLIVILTIIPVILWFPYATFSDTKSIFLSIGQALGLMGSVLLSINIILSGRFKFLESLFAGLNQIYIVHHFIGAIVLILLLYHPVFVALFYLKISIVAAIKILFSGPSNIPVFLGLLSLLVMIFALIFTFFIKLPYQIWKITHKFLGVSLLLASIHIFLIPSTVSKDLVLRFYILGLSALGLLAYLYRVLLFKFLVKRFNYPVESAKPIHPEVTEVILKPKDKEMKYQPGQFVFVDFSSLGIPKEVHPFSLTSSPESKNLSLAIKSSGDYTEAVKLLKTGALAQIEGPFGHFTYTRYENKRQIWVAGGIGITPFLSMARSLKPGTTYKIDLYYQVGVPEEAVYLDELKQISEKVPSFKIIPHFSKTQERLSAEIISKTSTDYLSADIFLCGPPPMMASLRLQFRKIGIKNSHIHSEEFSLQ